MDTRALAAQADRMEPARGGEDGRVRRFSSLRAEQAEILLPLCGRLPDRLSGTLLRNGPVVFETAATPLQHWFDGAAMPHRFGTGAGSVRHTGRRLGTRAIEGSRRTGKPTRRGFATDPCTTRFGRSRCCAATASTRRTAELLLRGSAPLELPRIDPQAYRRQAGSRQGIVHGIDQADAGTRGFAHAIGRQDLARGTTIWWQQAHCFAGERVFMPRPDTRAEAEGVLLSVALDTRMQRSFLLVLDAETRAEVARAETDQATPAGLHGMFQADPQALKVSGP